MDVHVWGSPSDARSSMSLQRDDVPCRAPVGGAVATGGRRAARGASGSRLTVSVENTTAPYEAEQGVVEAQATVPEKRGIDPDDR